MTSSILISHVVFGNSSFSFTLFGVQEHSTSAIKNVMIPYFFILIPHAAFGGSLLRFLSAEALDHTRVLFRLFVVVDPHQQDFA